MNDGGPAFPMPDQKYPGMPAGMSLRDYFAAATLQGMMARHDIAVSVGLENVPQTAFMLADKMLEARNK